MDQCVNCLLPTSLQETLDRAARDPHDVGRFLLLLPLSIAEPHGLKFIEAQFADVELRKRNPGWFVQIVSVDSAAVAHLLVAWHDTRV